MRNITSGLIVLSLALCATAWADDTTTTTTTTSPDSNRSETTTTDNSAGTLTSSKVDLKPMVGALVYTDATGSTTTRGMVGLGLDMNTFSTAMGHSPVVLGPDTGVYFAHQGSASSDFWGSNPNADFNSTGANIFIIPADLKLAFNFTDFFQIGAHGGANVIYRSDLGATTISTNEGTTGTHWGIYPNVGADVNFQLVRGMTISLRPDWTLTTGNNLFSGMLGLNFNLG